MNLSTPNPFLTQPVHSQLLTTTWHSLFGMMSVVLLGLVDMWFIGQLGLDELAALGFLGPVMLIFISVLMGCELTAAIFISDKLGEGKIDEAREWLVGILSYGVALSLVLLVVGSVFSDLLLSILGATGAVARLGEQYWSVWLLGYPALAICMIGTSMLRTRGQSRMAGRLLLFVTAINALLDPLFIFGLGQWNGWGMQGAAWASVVARVSCAIFVVRYLNRYFSLKDFNFSNVEALWTLWKNLVGLASTVTLNRLIIPSSTAIATGFMSQFGHSAVAALGVINVLQTFPVVFILALNSGLIPFLRQNASAGNIGRAGQAVHFAISFVVIWGCAQGGLFFVLSDIIAKHFSTGPQVFELLNFYYQYIPISMMGIGLFLVNNSVSYSFRQGKQVLKMNLIRVLFLYLPLVFVGGIYAAEKGVLVGLGLANVGMGCVALFGIRQHFRQGVLKK